MPSTGTPSSKTTCGAFQSSAYPFTDIEAKWQAFWDEHKDIQLSVFRGAGALSLSVQNAASSTIRGLEAEFVARPVSTLTLSGSLALLDTALRRRFEPATGLDCSEIFADDTVHPLAAAAIAEEFLDSDAAARFEDGVRYFFGRRIPE